MVAQNTFPGINAKLFSGGGATGQPISIASGSATTIHLVPTGEIDLVEVYVSNPTTAAIVCRLQFGLTDTVVKSIAPQEIPTLLSRHELGPGAQIDLEADAAGLFGWAIVTQKTPVP